MLKLLKEKQVRNALISLALVLATAGLVAAPDQAIAGAKDGLALCFNVIVPSLFPFFVVISLLLQLGLAGYLQGVCGPVMGPLFHMRGVCALPLLAGLLGGYPTGARTAAELRLQLAQMTAACFFNSMISR